MSDFAARRTQMVDTQVRPSDVTKFPIIDAMLTVPREDFVPGALREAAYLGENLDLGAERVMLDPRTLAKKLDAIDPDWSLLEWGKYIYVPLGVRVAIPNMARGCPFTCSFCSQWKFWRDYRIREPEAVVD